MNGADRSAFGLAIDVGEDGPCDAGTTPELDRIVGVVAHQDGLGDVADGDGLEACIPEKLTDPLRLREREGAARAAIRVVRPHPHPTSRTRSEVATAAACMRCAVRRWFSAS